MDKLYCSLKCEKDQLRFSYSSTPFICYIYHYTTAGMNYLQLLPRTNYLSSHYEH